MDKVEILQKRLKDKEDELKEKQYQFKIMFNNEKDSPTFERNAINNLLVMMQLKSEISELKYNFILQ